MQMRLITSALLAVVMIAGSTPVAAGQWGDRRRDVRRELREGRREIARERREMRRDIMRADSPWERRQAIREGAREIARERREMRREVRRELRDRW